MNGFREQRCVSLEIFWIFFMHSKWMKAHHKLQTSEPGSTVWKWAWRLPRSSKVRGSISWVQCACFQVSIGVNASSRFKMCPAPPSRSAGIGALENGRMDAAEPLKSNNVKHVPLKSDKALRCDIMRDVARSKPHRVNCRCVWRLFLWLFVPITGENVS